MENGTRFAYVPRLIVCVREGIRESRSIGGREGGKGVRESRKEGENRWIWNQKRVRERERRRGGREEGGGKETDRNSVKRGRGERETVKESKTTHELAVEAKGMMMLRISCTRQHREKASKRGRRGER